MIKSRYIYILPLLLTTMPLLSASEHTTGDKKKLQIKVPHNDDQVEVQGKELHTSEAKVQSTNDISTVYVKKKPHLCSYCPWDTCWYYWGKEVTAEQEQKCARKCFFDLVCVPITMIACCICCYRICHED